MRSTSSPRGTGDRPAGPVHAGRLRLRHPHRGRPRLHRGEVNGRLVPLDTRLNSADTVEIFTSKSATAGPSRDWLKIVASARARNRSASGSRGSAARTPSRPVAKSSPRRCAARACPSRASWASSALSQVSESMNLLDVDALMAAIGESQILAQSIVQRLPVSCAAGSPSSCRPPRPRACARRVAGAVGGRRLRRGPRRRDGAPGALLQPRCPVTRSSAS